jgi:hypothetical protein
MDKSKFETKKETPHLLVAGVVIHMDQDPARRMVESVITAADLIIFRKCVEVKNLRPKWKQSKDFIVDARGFYCGCSEINNKY